MVCYVTGWLLPSPYQHPRSRSQVVWSIGSCYLPPQGTINVISSTHISRVSCYKPFDGCSPCQSLGEYNPESVETLNLEIEIPKSDTSVMSAQTLDPNTTVTSSPPSSNALRRGPLVPLRTTATTVTMIISKVVCLLMNSIPSTNLHCWTAGLLS
jgi:hypothetical protein